MANTSREQLSKSLAYTMVVAFGIFLVSISAAIFVPTFSIAYKGYQSESWPETQGVIVDSKVEPDDGGEYKAKIRVAYEVDGQRYESEKAGYGKTNRFDSKQEVEQFLAAHATNIPVYYDPRNPGDGILQPGMPPPEHFSSVLMIFGPTLVLGLMALGFGLRRSIVQFKTNWEGRGRQTWGAVTPVRIIAGGGLIMLLTIVAFVGVRCAEDRLEDTENWRTTTGTVTLSELRWVRARRTIGGYCDFIEYDYAVNGRPYSSDSVLPLPGIFYDQSIGTAEERVKQYPRGETVEVFYDPDDPSDAALIVNADNAKEMIESFDKHIATGFVFGAITSVMGLCWLKFRGKGDADCRTARQRQSQLAAEQRQPSGDENLDMAVASAMERYRKS